MRQFEYSSAGTIGEALEFLQGDETRLLAGGTDLLTLMKGDLIAPQRLVDIKRAADLDGSIVEDSSGLTLGALVKIGDLEGHPLITANYRALADAAGLAATPQLRHMATTGGNLLQRPRCWYFRDSQIDCWLKGGSTCPAHDGQNQMHALFGGGPCYAVHPSDLAPALLALDAEVRLVSAGGERSVPLDRFFALPEADRRRETIIGADEIIHSISIPRPAAGSSSIYLKAMERKAWSFALVGVALALRRDAGASITAARLVLSGVAPIPWRVRAAEQLLVGAMPSAELFERSAEIALADAEPLAHNGYKIPLAKALIKRALASLTG